MKKRTHAERHASSRQKQELERVAGLADEEIDTTELPELPLDTWRKQGVVGKFYRPIKRPVTMRLDADVIAWLKADGPGYQTKANHLLRRQMLSDLRVPHTKLRKSAKSEK